MERPSIDLPQPDSPTRPSVSPASMARSTLPTACTTERGELDVGGEVLDVERSGHRISPSGAQRRRRRTSKASRKASPMRLQAITTATRQAPTGYTSHQ